MGAAEYKVNTVPGHPHRVHPSMEEKASFRVDACLGGVGIPDSAIRIGFSCIRRISPQVPEVMLAEACTVTLYIHT